MHHTTNRYAFPAADRDCRRDCHRQDGAVAGPCRDDPGRRDRQRRLAPGLSRPGYRHCQGLGRGPGARAASRAGSRQSRRAVQCGRLPAGSPIGVGTDRDARRRWRSWSAAPGCTCVPWHAAFRWTTPGTIHRFARTSSARLVGEDGLHTLVAELRSVAPGVAARTDLANPRRVVRALERVTVHGDKPPPPPQGYPAPSVWIGLQVEPAIHRDWIAARARAQFANGLLEEAADAPGALRPEPAFVLGVWLSRGFRRERRQPSPFDQAIDRDITRTNQFARRQRTWFRAEPDINWLDAQTDTISEARRLVDRL